MKIGKQFPLKAPQIIKWIVVGDASRFIVFEETRRGELKELKSFANQTAHMKISELEADRPGRSFASSTKSHGGHQTSGPRHSYSREDDPKSHAVKNFVNDLAAFLEKERNHHAFQDLVLIAEDKLLGQLRSSLGENSQGCISQTHAKDLAWMSGAALKKRVESLMARDG